MRGITIPLMEKLDRKCCEKADLIIADSFFVKNEIEKYYNIAEEKICVIPEGVDFELFNKAKGKKVLNGINLTDKRVLLFAGRIVPQKGLEFLIKAMPLVLKKIPNVVLLIVGSNTAENFLKKIKKLVLINKLNEKVFFMGKVCHEKMPEIIASSDTIVMPSTYEPFGIIALEALAANKQVIVGEKNGLTNFLKEFVFTVNPFNPESIAEQIINSFNEKKEINLLKIKEFDWNNVSKKIEEKLLEVIS
jgi:1,4-alpha-glucan branching enzyme